MGLIRYPRPRDSTSSETDLKTRHPSLISLYYTTRLPSIIAPWPEPLSPISNKTFEFFRFLPASVRRKIWAFALPGPKGYWDTLYEETAWILLFTPHPSTRQQGGQISRSDAFKDSSGVTTWWSQFWKWTPQFHISKLWEGYVLFCDFVPLVHYGRVEDVP